MDLPHPASQSLSVGLMAILPVLLYFGSDPRRVSVRYIERGGCRTLQSDSHSGKGTCRRTKCEIRERPGVGCRKAINESRPGVTSMDASLAD